MISSRRDTMPAMSFEKLLLVLISLTCLAEAQVGLRSLPVTSRNRSRHDPFAAWPVKESHMKDNFENELASIFKNVAYGAGADVSTTTSTTTTTTTTPEPAPFDSFYDFDLSEELDDLSPSSVPVSPPDKNEWGSVIKEEEPRPIQHQYVENPNADVETTSSTTKKPSSSITKSDFDFRDNSWVLAFGIYWQLYIYTCATLYTLIAIFSLICLARLHSLTNLNAKFYCITIYLFIFVASFFRSISFCYSPHNVDLKLPQTLASVLFNSPFPFVVTAFSILVFMLISTAKLRILPLKLQSPLVVGLISSILLFGSLAIDVICGTLSDMAFATGLRAAVQALTSGWNAALCIGYIFIHTRVVKSSQRQQREASRLAYNVVGLDGSPAKSCILPYFHHSARSTLLAAVCGLVLSILQVYGLMNTEALLNLPPFQPWIWFWFQSCCRVLELVTWITICIGAAFPMSNKVSKRSQSTYEDGTFLAVFGCGSCSSCSNISDCCRESNKTVSEDMYSTLYQSNHIARKMSFQHNGKPTTRDSVATTGPFSRISTTLLPPNSKSSVCKSATLRTAPGDVGQNIANFTSFPRPSSLFLNEKGQVNLYSRTCQRNMTNDNSVHGSMRKTPDFVLNQDENPYENNSCYNQITGARYGHYPRIIENYNHSQIYADPISSNDNVPNMTRNSSSLANYQYQSNPHSPINEQYQVPAYSEYDPRDYSQNSRYTPLYQQIPCSASDSPSLDDQSNGYFKPSNAPVEKISPRYNVNDVHGTTYVSQSSNESGATDNIHDAVPGSRGLLRKIVSPTFCHGGYSPLSSDHSNCSGRRNNVSSLAHEEDGQSDYLSYEESESPIRRPQTKEEFNKKLKALEEKRTNQDQKLLNCSPSKRYEKNTSDALSDGEKECLNVQKEDLSYAENDNQKRLQSEGNSRPFTSQLESCLSPSPDTIDFSSANVSRKAEMRWPEEYVSDIKR